jgi:hypothetical protein
MDEEAEDPGGMEQAEHELLADLRRARRTLRLQAIEEAPAARRLTLGQKVLTELLEGSNSSARDLGAPGSKGPASS